MFRISMHYYSTDHTAIISQILRREKSAMCDFMEGIYLDNQMALAFGNDNENPASHPPLDDFMETVVIKKWDDVLSVYPLISTPEQKQNESWVKHDTRKNSATQRCASLFVGQDEMETHIELWRSGELVCGSDIAMTGDATPTLFDLSEKCGDLYRKWVHLAPRGRQFDELPLFLPPNWKDEWSLTPLSQYVVECE